MLSTLTEVNLAECYFTENVIDIKLLKENLRQRQEASWQQKLLDKPKLRVYRQIKDSLCTENYVKLNLTRTERSCLAQLRSGTLPLRIETCRFVQLEENMRLCQLCNNGVENELHFLFKCSQYTEIRRMLFDNVNMFEMTDIEKFEFLCTNHPRKIAKFSSRAFKKRQEIIYNN